MSVAAKLKITRCDGDGAYGGGLGRAGPRLKRCAGPDVHDALLRLHQGGFLGRGSSMTAPGSRAKRSSSVSGRPGSLSLASSILRSPYL